MRRMVGDVPRRRPRFAGTMRAHGNLARLAGALRAPASQAASNWAWSASRRWPQRMGLRFDCPVITVAGTNGKGSTCAMLEAIALQAGYRTGVYTSPHLVHFEERCRIHGEIVTAQALVPHFERVEAARQGVSLTYFEFTTLAILSLMAASGAGRGDPGGRPGRAARRREHHRRRLRRDHQHRPGPHGLPGPRPREHRPREGRHHAHRQARHRERPGAAAERAGPGRRDRRRPVAAGPRLQLLGRQAAMGLGRARPALQRAWPIRRCAAPTS